MTDVTQMPGATGDKWAEVLLCWLAWFRQGFPMVSWMLARCSTHSAR